MKLPGRDEKLLGVSDNSPSGISISAMNTGGFGDNSAQAGPSGALGSFGSRSRPQIIYALVAHGPTNILVEHTSRNASSTSSLSGNFHTVAAALLKRFDRTVESKSYVYDNQAFHSSIDAASGIWFLCMADATMGRKLPLAFLQGLQEAFMQRGYQPERFREGDLERLQSDFGQAIQVLMEKWNSPDVDRATRLTEKVLSINESLMESMDKILERQEMIELLVKKSEALRESSSSFRTAARQVAHRSWWRKKRTMCMFSSVVVLVVLLIGISQCGVTFNDCF
jgi:vesicle-associated membrane protein 7